MYQICNVIRYPNHLKELQVLLAKNELWPLIASFYFHVLCAKFWISINYENQVQTMYVQTKNVVLNILCMAHCPMLHVVLSTRLWRIPYLTEISQFQHWDPPWSPTFERTHVCTTHLDIL